MPLAIEFNVEVCFSPLIIDTEVTSINPIEVLTGFVQCHSEFR
jgi:hypothetical protein